MPAKYKNMRHHGQFQCPLLIQHPALGGHVDHVGLGTDVLLYGIIAAVNGICLHDHAPAAAVGHIVHAAVLVQRILPNIPAADGNMTGGSGSADNALRQHRLAHFRKQSGDLNLHRTSPPAVGSASRLRRGQFPAPRPESQGSVRFFRFRL